MGGRYGGWDSRDHDSFLKVLTVVQAHGGYKGDGIIRSKIAEGNVNGDTAELLVIEDEVAKQDSVSIDPQFVNKFVTFLPGKTVDEIEEHIRWHIEYMSVQSEKKFILSEWKDEKSKQSGQRISRVDDTAFIDEDQSVPSQHSKRNVTKFNEANLAAKRDKVEQWRREKLNAQEAKKVCFLLDVSYFLSKILNWCHART